MIGFISVNIFRREPFLATDASRFIGTMYPQLGAMVMAFHSRPTLLLGRPLVCHRTQTQEEKKAALGAKTSEADFMASVERRNAIYFSHPFFAMTDSLIDAGAFSPRDIVKIRENTVIHGHLIDFFIDTVRKSLAYPDRFTEADWKMTKAFFDRLPLGVKRKLRLRSILGKGVRAARRASFRSRNVSAPRAAAPAKPLTVSVITPSYNQGEFLGDCLESVRSQTVVPIEHFVFDPGSSDKSREIASSFEHVTLVAEPDKGQSDAINKGFQRVKGDIIAWVNSDDMYADEKVFERVLARFAAPDAPDIVYGRGNFVDEKGNFLREAYVNKKPKTFPQRFQHEDGVLQPALFMRREVVEKIGLLNESNHYSMDYEYWIRCMKAGIRFAYIDDLLAIARYHTSNKTYGERGSSYNEVCSLMLEQFGYVNHIWLRRYAEFLAEGYDGVLARVANKGTKDQAKIDSIYRDLLAAYNGTYDVFTLLEQKASEKGYGDTLREMRSLGLGRVTPCRPVSLDLKQEKGSVLYTVGPRRWAFDAKWKQEQIEKAHAFLRERIAARKNDTCVIVGNGPSLNKTDLTLLEGQDVIISNNAFLSKELLHYGTYHTVVNFLVAEQSAHHINRLDEIPKILPYWLSYCVNPGPNTFFVDAVGYPEFSTDMFKNMSWRHTVTFFNMHLAYGLGYRKAVMIGFDHNFKQSAGVKEQEIILSDEDDENHFHPDYFRGKKWQAADVDMMEAMYKLAKAAFEADGRKIVNATVGGKLELFERQSLADALREPVSRARVQQAE
ncbi:MAG: glycosyltransferase [Methyloligella sp. ZOD6]